MGAEHVRLDAKGGDIDLKHARCDAVTFAALEELAALVDTKHINFYYEEEERDYSDLTPGGPSQCVLRWTMEREETLEEYRDRHARKVRRDE